MISLIFWMLAAVFNAVMDTVTHHWSASIFFKISKGRQLSFWGDPIETWKLKYIIKNNDIDTSLDSVRRKWFWKINYPVQFTDSWHFFKMLMIIFECAALALAIIYPPNILNMLDSIILKFVACFVAAGILRNIAFNIFYNKLLLSKTWAH